MHHSDGQGGFHKNNLVLNNCLNWAGVCTRTARDARICINYIGAVAFLDCFYWTCVCTRTARKTCISDFICHCCFTSGNQISHREILYALIIADSLVKCKWFSMESKKLFFSESHKSMGVEGLVILQYVPKPAGKWYRYGRLRGHKRWTFPLCGC